MKTDTDLERQLRSILRETLDAELGPDPMWAESPAARRVAVADRRRWPLRALAVAALVGAGGGAALLGGSLDRAPVVPWPAPSVSTERTAVGSEGEFVATGSMAGTGCTWCQAVVLQDGRVLVLGGTGQLYDPATWQFSAADGAPHPGASVLLEDGRVLVASMNEIALYDPATGTTELIENRSNVGVAAVRLADGKVLLVGTEPAGEGPGSALTFDPGTQELTPTGHTLAERQGDVRLVPLNDGRVLVVGGSFDGRSAELFDPATGTFSATGSMNEQRAGFTATRLADGRVLVVGGQSDTETSGSAEIYDPAIGAFTLTGSMDMPRFWHAAALLPDGRVLVIGGGTGGVRVDVGTFTEIYDPQTGQFTRGPVTNQPRVAATAVSVPQGVLVLGHYPGNVGGNAAASRTAEVLTLGPVERPFGCCLDTPGFVSVSAAAEQSAATRAALNVPAGALEGAVGASSLISVDWPGGGTGDWYELSLPNCSAACSIPIELPASSSGPPDAIVTVTVDIAYQGPPPPQASGIEVVIDAND